MSIYQNSVITSNITFSGKTYVAGTLTVNSPYTLTITDTVYCAENTCFIINPGARLSVNGGLITTICSDMMWKGIVYWEILYKDSCHSIRGL